MRHVLIPAALGLALIPAAARAEVVQSSPVGFEVSHSVNVAAPPDRVWPTVVAPRLWWDKDHTYSDDPANLTLDERPGGCFCERLPNRGGVEHMRVTYIQPPLMLRMTGGLGPLQAEAASGTLTVSLKRAGGGTTVTMSYVAGGYVRGGADKLAPVLDRVLGQQLAGLKAAVERGGAAAPAAPAAAARRAEPLADVAAGLSAEPAGPPAPVPTPAPRPADGDSPR